ncbi:hypothetical protein [Pseudonocardia alaniniphila]|uniref:Uncharacterized protein n=1 Tax=Pseudonocardia alaniniphila TaxID=75291 RepID=A0ABS9TBY6_9PSEU|nr:hypothetical protein [Pseudonocardia alaniniphila]MCH6166055.1 hypothetical protein [Pseudonocardia alaniniphila]
MSGVAEAIGRVPVVAAPAAVDDEGAVLEGWEVSAAPAAGPAVEGLVPVAERVDGGVVARAGEAAARCTVVPDPDPGDAVAEVGVVEGDHGAVCRLSVVLPVPAGRVADWELADWELADWELADWELADWELADWELAGGVRADDVVAAGSDAAGLVALGLVAVGSVGAGVVAAGVVAVRGGAAEVRGRRCIAAGPPGGDAADVLVVDVVDPPEEVDVLDLVDSLDAPDVLDALPVDEPPDVARPPDVLGGVDELAGRGVAELLLGVMPGVAGPVGEVGE